MQRLVDNPDYDFVMVCGRDDPIDHIPVWLPDEDFVETRTRKLSSTWFWQTRLWKVCFSRKYQTLIFRGNVYCASTWYAAFFARIMRKRVLFWGHGWIRRDRGIKKLMRQLFYCLPNGFLYYGELGKKIAIENGFDANETYVVNNSMELLPYEPVSPDKAREIKSQFFRNPIQPTVICTTRLHARKQIEQLMQAVSILADSDRVNVLIVGDGPEQQNLQSLAKELGIDCHFFGACYDETKMRELYSLATVSASPGHVGLTAIHSLNYGVPMLTNNEHNKHAPEYESIKPGVSGDFFEADNTNALADALKKWTSTEFPDDKTRSECISIVKNSYTAEFRERVILQAIQGNSADL